METPNYVAMFVDAQQAGRSQARRRAVENALAKAQNDPVAAQDELLRYGAIDEAGAVGKLAAQRRQQKVQGEVAPLVEAGDYVGARNKAIAGGDYELAKQFSTMNDDHLKQLEKNNQTLGAMAYYMGQIAPDQRASVWQQVAPRLIEMQVISPEQAQQVDLSDQSLQGYQSQALTVQQQIEMAFKQRELANKEADTAADNKRADAQLGETQRHNRTSEAIAGKNAATSAFSAQTGRMSYDARKAAGGFGTPGMGQVIGPNLTQGWELEGQ